MQKKKEKVNPVIEQQKHMIFDRVRLLFEYEFNHDQLMDNLRGQGVDIDDRIVNFINDLDEYINELLLIMCDYKSMACEGLSYYKIRKIKKCIYDGLSIHETCKQTSLPYAEILKVYKKYFKIR